MFQKYNTIKIRILIMAFIIMVLTVTSIIFTEYILKKNLGTFKVELSHFQINEKTKEFELEENKKIIIESQKEFEDKQQQKFVWLVSISSLLLIGGIVAIYLVIRRELKPLEKLKGKMDQMDFQTFKQELLISNKNSVEIVSLTNSFNYMICNLKKSYELQKQFNQNVAHELRTPITTMKASLQVNKIINKNQKIGDDNLLEILEEQVCRMEKMVYSLLQLNDRKSLKKNTVNVKEIIENCLIYFESQISERKISVSVVGEYIIETDENIFSIIIKNILENAIRYNKDAGTIKINLTNNIQIIDSGVGISKVEIDNIFSPFYCVDESRSKSLGGMGLGLSIVKEAIDLLGFELKLISEIDKGSTFIIETENLPDNL